MKHSYAFMGIIALFVGSCSAGPSASTDAIDNATTGVPSDDPLTVKVSIMDVLRGEVVSSGSGTWVDPSHIVTAWHVIDEVDERTQTVLVSAPTSRNFSSITESFEEIAYSVTPLSSRPTDGSNDIAMLVMKPEGNGSIPRPSPELFEEIPDAPPNTDDLMEACGYTVTGFGLPDSNIRTQALLCRAPLDDFTTSDAYENTLRNFAYEHGVALESLKSGSAFDQVQFVSAHSLFLEGAGSDSNIASDLKPISQLPEGRLSALIENQDGIACPGDSGGTVRDATGNVMGTMNTWTGEVAYWGVMLESWPELASAAGLSEVPISYSVDSRDVTATDQRLLPDPNAVAFVVAHQRSAMREACKEGGSKTECERALDLAAGIVVFNTGCNGADARLQVNGVLPWFRVAPFIHAAMECGSDLDAAQCATRVRTAIKK